MKIVYTAEPFDINIDVNTPKVQKRVARELLEATIEEWMMPDGFVNSYSISDNKAFPFPLRRQEIKPTDGFFGGIPKQMAEREIEELFGQPQKEITDSREKLEMDLKNATDKEVLEIAERFHYAPQGTRDRYVEAVAKIVSLWRPYPDIHDHIESLEDDDVRGELASALGALSEFQVKNFMKDMKYVENLLKIGKREEAIKNILTNYTGWEKRNLAPLYHSCGNAAYYGRGFWIARMVTPDGEFGKYREEDGLPKAAEHVLDIIRKPYQSIQI